MDQNSKVLFLALGLIVVVALFSNGFTGRVSDDQGGTSDCMDTDGGFRTSIAGTVVESRSGREAWHQDRCADVSFNSDGTEVARIVEYYCVGEDANFREVFCPQGTTCQTARDAGGRTYGVNAYCGR